MKRILIAYVFLYAAFTVPAQTNVNSIPLQGGLLPHGLMLGTDPASGTDSSEWHRIYGQILVNQTNTWLRQQFVRWSDIELSPGVYTFTKHVVRGVTNHSFDAWLAANTVANFNATIAPLPIHQPKIMFNIFNAPPWIVYTNSTQAQYIAAETNLVKAILRHAPGRIWAVEFTNEPFTNIYPGCATATDTATFVAKLAAAVRKAVHDVDPTVLIVGPSLTSPYDNNFMSAFSAAGGFTNLDAVSFHDYRMTGTASNAPTYTPTQNSDSTFMTNLAACVSNLNGWSGRKPIFVTELGLGVVSNVISYVTIANQVGIAGLAPTYFLGPQTPGQLYLTGYWDYKFDAPASNGAAYIATMFSVNHPAAAAGTPGSRR